MGVIQELIREREAIEARILEETRKGRMEAMHQIRAIANEYSLSGSDLSRLGVDARATNSAANRPAKYRNPATGATWTGMGKRPQWLRDAVEAGKPISSFLIGSAIPAAPPSEPGMAAKTAPAKKAPVKKTAKK